MQRFAHIHDTSPPLAREMQTKRFHFENKKKFSWFVWWVCVRDLYRLGNNAGNARKAFNKKTFSIQNSHPFMVQCSENMCFFTFQFPVPLVISSLALHSVNPSFRAVVAFSKGKEKKNRKYLCDCSWQFPGIYFTSTNSDFFLGIHHATKGLISPVFAHPKEKSVLWGPVIFISVIVESPFSSMRNRKVSYGGP